MKIFNSLVEGVKIAFKALQQNKVRASLTALCIIIGITMVTVVDSVTTGMDKEFDKSMSMFGTNVVYIDKWPWAMTGNDWWKYINRKEMKMEYVSFLNDNSRYASLVSVSASRNVTAKRNELSVENISLQGTTANSLEIQGLNIESGRMFTDEEARTGRNVVVIGKSLEDALFPNEGSLGKQIKLRGKKYTVIGILEKQGSFLGLDDGADKKAMIPIMAYGQIFSLRWGLQIGVKFPDEASALEGKYEIEGLMRRVRQLDATEENDFALNEPKAFEDQLSSFKTGLYAGGFLLVGLSLLIGGIGVMNIMFVSVRERTKEIGIRKAVGAKSWEILVQFLIEAIVICLLGGVIGIVLAGGITVLINQVFTAVMNMEVVLFAFLLCTVIGATFGFIPAYRAAKSDPIESLRYD